MIPVNQEAENAFVGTLLIYPDQLVTVRTEISPDDIYTEPARQIYKAMCAIQDKGKTPTMPMVIQHGVKAELVTELAEAGTLSMDLENLAEIIQEDSRKRRLLAMASDVGKKAQAGATSGEILTTIEAVLSELNKRAGSNWVTNSDLLARHCSTIEQRYKYGGVVGTSTGFVDLDNELGGLVPGNLIMLCAVPKSGKTAAALHMALHAGVPTLFFTLEMIPEELADRELAMKARISAKAIRTGKFAKDAWDKISEACGELSQLPLAFVSRSGLTVGDIRAICQQYKQQNGLGLVIIDQLDKIYEPANRNENQTVRIGRVTSGLKNIARDLEVPVVCLAQLLDKAVAQRQIPRPKHGDIRDSSYPDQDADVVLYLWRPSLYWPEKAEWRNLVEIIISRSRATAEGSVWVRWVPEFTLFQLLDRASWPEVKDDIVLRQKQGTSKTSRGG